MVRYSMQQVVDLAPDQKALERARKSASPRKWSGLGTTERACWGLAAGSGKSPYQVVVDLHEPAFKCSCPSKIFPCKHSLALLLIHADSPTAFGDGGAPEWVDEWLAKRDARASRAAAKGSDPAAPVRDEAAQQKRVSAREEKVAGGIAELSVWLADLARQGLADLPSRPYDMWDRMAARLVDAQCAPLARQVRELGSLVLTGDGWQDTVLERLGRLRLIVEAWGRVESLPELLVEDLRTQIGFTQNLRELAAGDGLRDTWQVVARHVEDEDRLRVQRTWLRGIDSGRIALVLDFAHGGGSLDVSLVAGLSISAELVFLPSAVPLRAIIKERFEPPPEQLAEAWHVDVAALLADYADCLGRNPWHERHPAAIADARVQVDGDRWILADATGAALPLAVSGAPYWSLLAATAGRAAPIFGEWDGHVLTPLAVAVGGTWQSIGD